MTNNDHRVLFHALGVLAVIIGGAQDKQARRATGIAELIESFCALQIPAAFPERQSGAADPFTSLEASLERHLAALRDGSAETHSLDRDTLFKLYEFLLIEKTRREEKEFYASAPPDAITQRIRQLVES